MSCFQRNTDIHVWYAALNEHNAKHLDVLNSCLSKDEKYRADRFFRDSDRRRFVVGRGGLRVLLGLYQDQDPAELRFIHNRYGKPSLHSFSREGPLFFNLSHSANILLFAFTPASPVGIDVQKIDPDLNVLEIAHRFFASSEYRELVTLPEERRREAFFRVWTRKEACIKAVGKGFSIEPSCFRVTLLPEQPARLLNADSSSLQKKAWSLIDIDCGTGYKAAMATAIPEIRMYSFVWSPQTLLLQEKSVFKRVKSLLPLMRTA